MTYQDKKREIIRQATACSFGHQLVFGLAVQDEKGEKGKNYQEYKPTGKGSREKDGNAAPPPT